MSMGLLLKRLGLVLLIGIFALPLAFFLTIMTHPFWRWLEKATGIESYGHSGPADWCHWTVYGILVLTALFVWWFTERRKRAAGDPPTLVG